MILIRRLPKFEVGAIHELSLLQISMVFHTLIQQCLNSIDPPNLPTHI
jgi:hypothetical protein